MKVLLLTREPVGVEVIEWIMNNYPNDISVVVTDKYNNNIINISKYYNLPYFVFSTENQLISDLKNFDRFDLGIMFWWNNIISKDLLSIPFNGFINTHPALLPYNAGVMANIWTFIDDTPYGVTIHKVTTGIDDGPIIAQKKIEKSWEDTENTLYHKSIDELKKLFFKIYHDIRQGYISFIPQDMSLRTFHTFKDTELISKISLDAKYTVREILNILRSHSYLKKSGVWFEEDGKKFEVRISIKQIEDKIG